MKTELQWTEKGGNHIASSGVITYCVWHGEHWNAYIEPGNFKSERQRLDLAKAVCQSHHDAICKAVEEAFTAGKQRGAQQMKSIKERFEK